MIAAQLTGRIQSQWRNGSAVAWLKQFSCHGASRPKCLLNLRYLSTPFPMNFCHGYLPAAAQF